MTVIAGSLPWFSSVVSPVILVAITGILTLLGFLTRSVITLLGAIRQLEESKKTEHDEIRLSVNAVNRNVSSLGRLTLAVIGFVLWAYRGQLDNDSDGKTLPRSRTRRLF